MFSRHDQKYGALSTAKKYAPTLDNHTGISSTMSFVLCTPNTEVLQPYQHQASQLKEQGHAC